jgi:hypothetical protein
LRYVGGYVEQEEALDVVHDGKLYECMDVQRLLGTPCGYEFEVTLEPVHIWNRIVYPIPALKLY